ncbi:hypothetical protein [Pseudalkalibacillus berkeleyi]|uniref:UPF0738 protein L2716_03915 n=1 Tax=Pseudalkalibacillus berkeleyi TaxID=1069813 RepID=A0ABS9GVN0_9BACL|nr:hypothetical protein [Pseudalkalibacillus berkeleyi]MCF6136864.1 hypothetical protein [Pseudalkalibacillus berkeleyi]
MTTRLEITSCEVKEDTVQFSINSESLAKDLALEPSGQVLVDSDSLSFIYILETEDSFIYVSIPKDYWSDMKTVLTDGKDAVLQLSHHGSIPMVGLKDELEYLIQNISGNANYGSEMMNSVEEIFQPVK